MDTKVYFINIQNTIQNIKWIQKQRRQIEVSFWLYFSVFIQTLRKRPFSNSNVKCASRITIMQLHVALAYTLHKTVCLVHRFKQEIDAELTFSF